MKEKQHKETIHSEEIYIGETARTLRQRSTEHREKLKYWGRDSFILKHWMLAHGTDPTPPEFDFSVVKKFKEPLRYLKLY